MAGLDLQFSGATTVDGVLAEMLDELFDRLPDLDPADVDVEEALLAAAAVVASTTRTLLVDRILADYRRFGEVVHDLAPIDAVAATAETTWTLRDTGAPVTIPAGTRLGWPGPDGETLFELDADLQVSAGTTSATQVLIRAVTAGTAPVDGLEPADLTLVDRHSAVVAVEATSLPSGAVDAETRGQYEDRLAERVQLYGETLVIPADMRQGAEQQPEVGRALALDGYDPDTDTFDNELVVTVALTDEDGRPLAAATRDDIASRLNDPDWRAANRVTHTIDATYTQVTVTADVTVADGHTASSVIADATQRVYDHLHPASWDWRDTVERDEVFYVIRDTDGVVDVANLTLNGAAGDVALSGVAPLPTHPDDPNSPTTVTLNEA